MNNIQMIYFKNLSQRIICFRWLPNWITMSLFWTCRHLPYRLRWSGMKEKLVIDNRTYLKMIQVDDDYVRWLSLFSFLFLPLCSFLHFLWFFLLLTFHLFGSLGLFSSFFLFFLLILFPLFVFVSFFLVFLPFHKPFFSVSLHSFLIVWHLLLKIFNIFLIIAQYLF